MNIYVWGSIGLGKSGWGPDWQSETRPEWSPGQCLLHPPAQLSSVGILGRQQAAAGCCYRWRSAPQCWTGSPDWTPLNCVRFSDRLHKKQDIIVNKKKIIRLLWVFKKKFFSIIHIGGQRWQNCCYGNTKNIIKSSSSSKQTPNQ